MALWLIKVGVTPTRAEKGQQAERTSLIDLGPETTSPSMRNEPSKRKECLLQQSREPGRFSKEAVSRV